MFRKRQNLASWWCWPSKARQRILNGVPQGSIAQMKRPAGPTGRSPLTFFLLVFALAIPFLMIGAVTGIQLLPGLPVAAAHGRLPGDRRPDSCSPGRWGRRREGPAEESFRLPPDQGEGLVRARPASDDGSDGLVVRRDAMERNPGSGAANRSCPGTDPVRCVLHERFSSCSTFLTCWTTLSPY
jgi:hypothetical protein